MGEFLKANWLTLLLAGLTVILSVVLYRRSIRDKAMSYTWEDIVAREAISNFAGGVLSESNLGGVVVDVRLRGHPQQQAVNDQWDRSRSVNEVLDQGAK